jgi:hypothetical protein
MSGWLNLNQPRSFSKVYLAFLKDLILNKMRIEVSWD